MQATTAVRIAADAAIDAPAGSVRRLPLGFFRPNIIETSSIWYTTIVPGGRTLVQVMPPISVISAA
ncbi:hypothetical protein [Nocardia cyriacigeorgica]|uniref:hypothetical protein n=1 Tax=Nocardia cyriacigeorgica TaxID=135487 RepID=UPI002453B0E0|nr:hypothetical protein [Nocardia cyriacigeorgica]